MYSKFALTYGMDNALVQSHATALTKDDHAKALVELLQIDAKRSEEFKKIHLRVLKQEEEKTSLQAQLRATKDELTNEKTNKQNLADQLALLQVSNDSLQRKVNSLGEDNCLSFITCAIVIGGLVVLSILLNCRKQIVPLKKLLNPNLHKQMVQSLINKI